MRTRFVATVMFAALASLGAGCGKKDSGDKAPAKDTPAAPAAKTAESTPAAPAAPAVAFDEAKAKQMMQSLVEETDDAKMAETIKTVASMGPDVIAPARYAAMDMDDAALSAKDQGNADAAAKREKAAVMIIEGVLAPFGAKASDGLKKFAETADMPLVRASVCASLKALGESCPDKK